MCTTKGQKARNYGCPEPRQDAARGERVCRHRILGGWKNAMVAYGIAKARAMANRTDWNERTEITKAVITWFDADYEYELEIENEGRMDNEEFTAWVEENAESLAKADAESLHTVCEEIDSIDFTEKEIDDDALFDEEYENACEFEWVTPHGVGRCPEGTEGTGTC